MIVSKPLFMKPLPIPAHLGQNQPSAVSRMMGYPSLHFGARKDTVTLKTAPIENHSPYISMDKTQYFIQTPAYPEMVDQNGHLRAGHLLKLIDIAGSMPAFEFVGKGKSVVTASMDRTNIVNPIKRWEMIRLHSRITQVWQSSLESEVTVSAYDFRFHEERPVATAYLVFVGLDDKRQKIAMPPLANRIPELAKAADIRKASRQQEGRELPILPIEEADGPFVSVVETEMTPQHANALNNVFGGVILDHIDQAGSLAAKKVALEGFVTGVRQDRMSFISPAYIGETLRTKAIVTRSWRTSMEVQVEVEAVNPANKQVRKIASSYLVYVKLGANGNPAEFPPWVPLTETQKKRAEAADKRRANRELEEKQTIVPQNVQPPMTEKNPAQTGQGRWAGFVAGIRQAFKSLLS